MKNSLILIGIFAFISYINCGEFAGRGCTISGEFVKVGQTYQPEGLCELSKCTGFNKVSTLACAEKESGERCFRKPVNAQAPYPECCPQWICN